MKYLIMILFVSLLSNDLYRYKKSAKLISSGAYSTCPANTNNPNNISKKIIEKLLNSSKLKNDRIESGIDGLNIANLKLLKTNTDDLVCTKLNEFVEQWELDRDVDWKYTYYKNEEFYFLVLWYNGSGMGFSPVYVFDSNFKPVGIWTI